MLIAYVYEGLCKTEDAFNWLEKAINERDGWLVFLNAYPRFDSLRGVPRFEDILNSLGLPDIDHSDQEKRHPSGRCIIHGQ